MCRVSNYLGITLQVLRAGVIVFATAITATRAAAYIPDDRWSITANGTTGAAGTPITLTWSLMPDGTSIPGEGASNLISYFDGLFNVGSTSGGLTQRPWFDLFEESFARWSALGGITFNYEPIDNGATLDAADPNGVKGVRGDVRIGGQFLDGATGTLAYSYLPNSGDMVIDTGETNFYSNPLNNYRQARNTIMHELGHGFGLLHIESSTDNLLMEPFINATFDGPQLDDIRGIQGMYGDTYEKTHGGLGNGAYQRATALGQLASGSTLDVGSDAIGGQTVSPAETDFVSIANSADTDFYSFTISAPSLLDATLTPLGGVFNQGPQGGAQSSFNANARNDLTLSIFGTNGTTLLGSTNLTAAGGIESLIDVSLPTAGTYFARITGSTANVQLYQLQLSASLALVTLVGDYNNDGRVDSLDYTLWRNTLGTGGSNLSADGNGNGRIDAGDFTVWKNHYGETSSGGGGIAGSVPEPSSMLLTLLALTALTPYRRRRLQ